MFFASSGVLALTRKTTPCPSVRKYHWSILPARYAFTVSCTSCGMIWARWAGVMGVPMKWEIARIFVVGTGGSGFCAEAARSVVIGFCMEVAPYSLQCYLRLSSRLSSRQARVDPTENVRDDQFPVDVIQQVVKVAFVKFNRFVSRPGRVIEELAPAESGGLVGCAVQDQ